MSELIRLEGVGRRFHLGGSEVLALDGVSLAIEAGEYLAVMGPSGSGKSTLLNVLGLLDRPDEGEYWLEGARTARLAEPELARLRGQAIGFVFQSFHLVPRLTAFENVALPLMLAGMAPAERTARVAALLAELGLSARADHRPAELSGGQRQRVAIARAMVTQPRLLLADEPTGNLDSRSGDEVIALLEHLNRERGVTLVVVTHDERIGARAGRRIRMNDGRLEPPC
ncbi:ABC transporter ATP-binding protein [Aeromonas taiwanensis]|uniref:ABC transporter ATP-binding protein n=1 Tax=Aeromonas taiwanensis TaxID=633417 RepID=A0A5F0KD62_9GAMM|nr:ABC transporter ATP-binding protein [Aeromonas taiwanensis]TFF78135.1 ABC transporter ATP-binding protein [Aeromonas taiwanensis]TFF78619.1 ABC transporter ATP-binding protein [Aeromonas taiwanensis]TFF82375.1 ABC transporter ATP-binding protein [Aeromonas taiwanensis]